MCRYHRISLRNKSKKKEWTGKNGKNGVEKHLEEVGLPRGLHKLGGLGSSVLLMNYLTQTNLMMTISKL